MDDTSPTTEYNSAEDLILARLAGLLKNFFTAVAALTAAALALIVVLPGFATTGEVVEPFVRNTAVLITIGCLYVLLVKGRVITTIFGTVLCCMGFASYTVFIEAPVNLPMLGLMLIPTGLAGFLPRRSQFWAMYGINLVISLVTIWMVIEYRFVELSTSSVVTMVMLQTLLALLIDTMSTSYRDSVRVTFEQLQELKNAQEKLKALDADLDVAVSERIRAESVSDQLAKTGRLAMEAAGAGTFSANLETRQVNISQDFMDRFGLGSPPGSLTALYELIHLDDRAQFSELMESGTSPGERLTGDVRINSSEPLYWMFILESATDASGKSVYEGVLVDVTQRVLEQKRRYDLKDRAHESQRLESLGILAGAIAHDFNNLLHVIMLNADLARSNLNPDSKSATSLERLMVTVERAAELCSELLAYSGRGQFTIEPFELDQLIGEMKNLLELSTPKGVHVNYETDNSDPVVKGDVTQVRQVVMNLITNAGEAIGNNQGEITLRLSTQDLSAEELRARDIIEDVQPGSFAVVEVADTGCGMSESTMKRVFDPFFTTKETGHGLGLSAVLGIIRGHEGAISVKSTPGEGTSITLFLPLTDRPPVDETEDLLFHADSNKRIILFADDEEEIRQLAQAVLEDSGYQLLHASDGQLAIDIFKEHHEKLSLVILDLMMPNKTGLEAYFEISEFDPSIPVVFSSGFNESELLQKLPPRTRSGFLKKPYLADDLRKFVDGIIGNR